MKKFPQLKLVVLRLLANHTTGYIHTKIINEIFRITVKHHIKEHQ
jgi:hypothetical protein